MIDNVILAALGVLAVIVIVVTRRHYSAKSRRLRRIDRALDGR